VAVRGNDVTVVINCCVVVTLTLCCCKGDELNAMVLMISLGFENGNGFVEVGRNCILFTDSFSNSALTYF
jgi:hypothetical protein